MSRVHLYYLLNSTVTPVVSVWNFHGRRRDSWTVSAVETEGVWTVATWSVLGVADVQNSTDSKFFLPTLSYEYEYSQFVWILVQIRCLLADGDYVLELSKE